MLISHSMFVRRDAQLTTCGTQTKSEPRACLSRGFMDSVNDQLCNIQLIALDVSVACRLSLFWAGESLVVRMCANCYALERILGSHHAMYTGKYVCCFVAVPQYG